VPRTARGTAGQVWYNGRARRWVSNKTTTMPIDSNPESIANLLQALDELREAARRVDRERNLAAERRETAAGAAEPQPPNTVDDDL
jgi:hypothetical protein